MKELGYYKSLLLEETNDIVLITNNNPKDPRIVFVNRAFKELSGYSKEEVLGKSPRILQGPKTCQETLYKIRKALEQNQQLRVELLNYDKDGQEYWLDFSITPLFDEKGKLAYFAAIERDITHQKLLQNDLYTLANTDPLTNCYNRHRFYELAATALANKKRYQTPFGILVIDIDDFKHINDKRGHLLGDEVLKAISFICKENIRETDAVCRFGGDEFIILMHQVNENILNHKACNIIEQIKAHDETRATVSIGGTLALTSDKSIDDLITRADQALYKVKEAGKGLYKYQN